MLQILSILLHFKEKGYFFSTLLFFTRFIKLHC